MPTPPRTSTLLLLAAALAGMSACDADAGPPLESQAVSTPEPQLAPIDDNAAAPDERAVASGLDVGQRLAVFDIINTNSGKRYCQICEYGPFPTIMAVGTVDDPQFHEDIVALEAIVNKFGADKVKAFAVIAVARDGALVTPTGDKEALMAQAKALREELQVQMPIVIPAPNDGAINGTFEDHYRVSKSRTIMFADKRKQVKFSAVAPADFDSLEATISEVLG